MLFFCILKGQNLFSEKRLLTKNIPEHMYNICIYVLKKFLYKLYFLYNLQNKKRCKSIFNIPKQKNFFSMLNIT